MPQAVVTWVDAAGRVVFRRVAAEGRLLDFAPQRVSLRPTLEELAPSAIWTGDRFLISWISMDYDRQPLICAGACFTIGRRAVLLAETGAFASQEIELAADLPGFGTPPALAVKGDELAIFWATNVVHRRRISREGVLLDPAPVEVAKGFEVAAGVIDGEYVVETERGVLLARPGVAPLLIYERWSSESELGGVFRIFVRDLTSR